MGTAKWNRKTLPTPGEYVLVTCAAKSGRRTVLRAYHDGERWCGNIMSTVISWMPMPTPDIAPWDGD